MISIIIPAFQEEGNISRLINYLRSETAHSDVLEIIVTDGKSGDRTAREAEKAGAQVIIASKRGRAGQMNEGARRAKGFILYFLHADTRPPATYADDIIRTLTQKKQAGCFRLSFDDPHFLLTLFSWFTRFNIKTFRFGDQSLFITRELFEQVGGFDESLTVMEDNEIFDRITKYSGYSIIPKKVITSARKYKDNGIIRLQLIYTLIFMLFKLEVGQNKLVRVYKRLISD